MLGEIFADDFLSDWRMASHKKSDQIFLHTENVIPFTVKGINNRNLTKEYDN